MSELVLESWRELLVTQPIVVWIWVTLVGACIGSFLNVVIYRLPARLSLSRPGSHCPRCQQPIRWYDNVPIAAWCWLRGRCRNCQLPISPRYPLVEALVGLLFAWLWYLDVYAVTPTLDIDPALQQAISRFCLHANWLVLLLVYTGIDFDRHQPTRSLLVFTILTMGSLNAWVQRHDTLGLIERVTRDLPVALACAAVTALDGWLDRRLLVSIKQKKRKLDTSHPLVEVESWWRVVLGGLAGWIANGWRGLAIVVVATSLARVGQGAGWPRLARSWSLWLLVATLVATMAR